MDAQSLSDDIYSKVQSLQDEANTALSRLESVVGIPYLSWFNMADIEPFEPQRVGGNISTADIPTLEKLDVPATANLTIDMMEGYKNKVWKSPELEKLEALMMQYIDTGGTGINAAVEAAIYERARERDLQALRDAMDLAGARTGARGARYPNSMTKAQQSEAISKYLEQKGDLNREIVKIMTDLAQKNTQFATSAALDIEKAYMDFSRAFIGVILDINRGILENFRITQEARIAEFEGQLRGIMGTIEVQMKNAELERVYNEQLMEKWKIESGVLLEKGKAQIAQAEHANSLRLSATASLASAYVGMMNSMQSNAISLVKSEGE